MKQSGHSNSNVWGEFGFVVFGVVVELVVVELIVLFSFVVVLDAARQDTVLVQCSTVCVLK